MLNQHGNRLPLFHAGSLTATFAKINTEFKKLHPDVEIMSEAAGTLHTGITRRHRLFPFVLASPLIKMNNSKL